jgi:type 1 glutamine amidotransferase
LTVLHAANNPFVGWADYERMIGLQWDARSTHTRYIPIDVKIAYPTHPITSRMPDFTTTDELYGGLANRQNVPVQVLATAWSDPEQRGTGNVEPVLIVLEFGAGRVFQSILGHAAGAHRPLESFESEHVRRLLVRGCEWAATGKVTL